MGATADILHADLDAFYAGVEQRDRPELADRPLIVGGGVVLAASYEARARGVRTAMSGGVARRLCPEAVVVPPRMDAYAAASREVFAVFRDTTPLVEGLSIDEAFLDVSGLRRLVGPPVEIARTLRDRVRREVGLALSVGVARTKYLAKVASAVSKPDGLLVVEPDEEDAFLHPLGVRRLWGVGPKTAERLEQRGLRTVGDVARLDERTLVGLLGPSAGRHLHALARHRDPRPVVPERRRASIGAQRALGRGATGPSELDAVLVGLVDRVAGRLRAGRRTGRTVVLGLRDGEYRRETRSRTLAEATDDTATILRAARGLLAERADHVAADGVTLVAVTVANLVAADALQLALPFESRDRGALDRAVDAVRDRFGRALVGPASSLHHDDRSVPVLPDPGEVGNS